MSPAAELYRRSPALVGLAAAHALLFGVLLVLMLVDDRQVTGALLWQKPAKFALSITVYLLTMAWLLGELQRPRWLIGVIVFVVLASMSLEQILITLQAARETTSHYNVATAFDAAIFSLMGFGVFANSAAAAAALYLFMTVGDSRRPGYWWGIRLGLAIFLLGSVQGFLMIANAGHTVGAPDGGPGLPGLGWSTRFGDLRIAHFIGIHAIQVLPLAGWLLDRTGLGRSGRIVMVWGLAFTYAAVGVAAHLAAAAGQSWFAWV